MRTKRIFSVLLALLSVLLLFTVSASALTWDGSSAGGSTSAVNGSSTGYVIRSTNDDYCVVGYRFSVVNSAGNLKVNKVIDVYRNTTNGDNAYSTSAKFSTKYNKKQLIANKNATLTTTSNTTNCYKEKDMGFVSKLPNPSGVETWQKYETNINKVLTKICVGTTANMVYGDKVIIEPLFDVCLAGEYQALTVTEIAYCGRSVKGGSSDGGTSNGTSSTWGFIANYTNRIWPNKLYTPNGQGLWTAASALSSKTTFDNIMDKGYGAGIAYNETTKIEYTIKFDGNGSTSGSTASMSMIYGTAKNLTANGFKRTGYKFTGWNTKANGSGTKYSDKQSVNNLSSTNGATVTLYAQWTPNILTVMYDCYGSSVTIDKSKGFFLGDYNRLCSTKERNKELWGTKNVYYQTFNYNDKIGGSGLHDFATFGLTAPTGYKFNGWYCGNGKTFDETTTTYKPTDFTDAIKTGDAEVWLSARFSAIKYTITHDPNGGGWGSDKAKDTRNYTINGTVNILVAPTKTGYTFTGWKVITAAGNWTANKVYTVSGSALSLTGMYGNVTLTAQWSPISYSVKFNGNGSTSGSMSNQKMTYDKAANLTANAFKRAFVVTFNYNDNGKSNTTSTANAAFNGWATSASGQKVYNDKQSVKNLTATANATVNLYAKWTDASVTLPTPTRTGYIFNGWFTAASGGTKVGAGGASYTPSKNITLYAQWSPITYTIKFIGNGSTSGSMANMSMTYDVAKNLTDNAFKRTGYSFTGWNTKADGSGTKYTNKQSVKNLTTTNGATITLYAQWTPDSYTIKFNGNGSTSGSMSDLKMTYDVAKNLTANAFKKTGYTFKNWNTKADGTGTSYADKQSVKNLPVANGNTITLYAQWTPITYIVRFNGNGAGSGTMADQKMTYDTAANLTANAFKKTGYVFSGWATSATGSKTYNDKQSVKNLSSTQGAVITLYAKWTPITYTIKFNGNNSTSGSMSNLSMTYDTAKTLTANAYKRTGYTFNGWNTIAHGSGAKYTDKQSVKNLTTTQGATVNLYAQWNPIGYAVKFNGNGSTSGSMNNQSFVYDKAQNLSANAFKREFTITYNYNYSGASNTTAKASAAFNGWATSASGKVVYTDKQSVKNLSSASGTVVNIYAKWTDKAVTLPTPTRTGYVFDGWYTSASSGSKIGSGGGSYTPSKDITVYAHWTPITYTIKFNGNNASSGTMANLSMTYDVAKTLTANAYKRTGYTYAGWNTKADGTGTAYSDKQSVKNLTATQGATVNLYAQWKPIGYSVKFNGNGSTSGSMSNQAFVYDVAQNLTANAFKREFTITYNYNYAGKTNTTAKATAAFNGWATSATGSVVYSDKQNVKNLSATSGAIVNVYAKWSDAKATLPTPTRTGYTFDGWYTTATGGTKIGEGGSSYTTDKDITVYAHWTPITYTIKFDGNKATSGTMSNLSMTYDVEKNLTANAYVRTGYIFTGWNTAADGKGTAYADKQSVKNLTATDKVTITLYAQWKPISYTIRFNGNGASSASMSDLAMTYDVEKTLTANAFVKNAAEFVKWNTKADGTGTDYADKQVVKNLTTENGKVITLYAQWKNLRELSLEAITPNAAYRESTEVITSFNLVNKGEGVCLPSDNVSVVFKVYKDSTVIKTVTQTGVVVPGNEKNLLYFKWTVPTNLGSSKIYVSGEIVENNSSYGLIKNQYATCKYNVYATPDTQYEASAPDGFTVPGTPTAKSDTAKWSVWTYENNAFKKLNYGMSISDTTATITPDESANAEQQGGIWVMKSGYGYGISQNNGVKTLSGYTAAPAAAYTNAQYALALFPEFGYAQTQDNSRTLELVSGKWIFRENSDYGRIHFTPLWYPDGNYTAAVLQSDCWTPAGMISRLSNTNTITISGSAYDDWFIG